ncbi:MerR family transcriptional regulator [Paracoccus sp. S-4012]|uniref:MerR family transcriptional regulator n=1 Tax=Paracoccus sp. S-4012 TaxID=2665648 RepID=UPI0012B072B6|nr:MerR family transcriptional regulator [Paracoccus sp. S-4012]MRX50813.1 MerR family transcriptional regulator [Paracoccus sp. S-4012]
MKKSADAYRSIGEVAKLIGVAPHVLRYWETQFPQLAPVKRADGRRYYRLEDVRLAAGLAEVMREEGLTTRGAAKLIAQDKGATVRARGLKRLPAHFGGEAPDPETAPAQEAAPRTTPARRGREAAATGTDGRELPLFDGPDAAAEPMQAETAVADAEMLAQAPAPETTLTLTAVDEVIGIAEGDISAAPTSGEWLTRLALLSGSLRDGSGRALPPAALHRLTGELRRLLEPRV